MLLLQLAVCSMPLKVKTYLSSSVASCYFHSSW